MKPLLRAVNLPVNTVLYKADHDLEEAYFLESGFASQVVTMRDGGSAEIGIVGHEGVVGSVSLLGTRRMTVTAVAGALQRSGLIEYKRGRIHIVDRPALGAKACECYGHINASTTGCTGVEVACFACLFLSATSQLPIAPVSKQ